MTKFRCFVDVTELIPGVLTLSAEESTHVAAVLRVAVGESVCVINGRGQEAQGRVVCVDKRAVQLDLSCCITLPDPKLQVSLFVGLPKLSSMEIILQKSTELGVARIIPVLSAHSVVKVPEDKRAARVERWKKIVLSAVKQCRNPWMPEILPIVDFNAATRSCDGLDWSFVGSLMDGAVPFQRALRSHESGLHTVGVWIGPEGDFSAAEHQRLMELGVAPVSFGDRILRTETAVVASLAVLNYELDTSA